MGKDYTEKDIAIAQAMYSMVARHPSITGRESLIIWARTINEMREEDERAMSEILYLFQWCSRDPYWMQAVYNPQRLRKLWSNVESDKDGRTNRPEEEKKDTFSSWQEAARFSNTAMSEADWLTMIIGQDNAEEIDFVRAIKIVDPSKDCGFHSQKELERLRAKLRDWLFIKWQLEPGDWQPPMVLRANARFFLQ